MLSITQTTNLSGNSLIDEKTVMMMYASIPENGSLTINQTITNTELYLANQTQCDTDYETFRNEVDKILQSMQKDTKETIETVNSDYSESEE